MIAVKNMPTNLTVISGTLATSPEVTLGWLLITRCDQPWARAIDDHRPWFDARQRSRAKGFSRIGGLRVAGSAMSPANKPTIKTSRFFIATTVAA